MKKNRLFILGLVTVFVALVSLTLVSSTWAKYTTSAKGEDSARVAYWGFNEEDPLAITDLFKKSYNHVTGSDDVIAPGTEGEATFMFSYKDHSSAEINAPEVAYKFTVDVTGSHCDDSIINNANIQWKLDSGDWGEWDDLLASIKSLSGDASGSKTYDQGAFPAAFGHGDNAHTIQWRWTFSEADSANTTDTAMGNADTLASVKIVIKITAEQID